MMDDFPSTPTPVNCQPATGKRQPLSQRLALGLAGAGLPCFLLAATLVYELFLGAVMLAPAGAGLWGGFAQEFKVWCFSYDPRTGGMEWTAFWVMMAEPLFITGIALALWLWQGVGARRRWRWHAGALTAGSLAACLAIAGLVYVGRPSAPEAVPPFPGARIRTQLQPPEFALRDQRGALVSRRDLQGRVVLVTGIYTQCATTCPEILLQIHRLLPTLPPAVRERLEIVALSLNPEYDTAELMEQIAQAYGLDYPQFRFLNGDPEFMHTLLRDLQFAPRYNERTGTIDHANLFLLLDAEGRIAYRLNLNPRHETWLQAAVLSLAEEAKDL